MAYRSIFGQDLTDYEIDVIVDNGIVASEWAVISRRAEAYQRRFGPNRVTSFIAKLLKGAGVAAGAVSVLTQSALRKKGDEAPGGVRGVKRATIPDDEDQPESDPKRAKTSPNVMPFSNSPPNTPTTRMSGGSRDGQGSGNAQGTKETPVDEIVNVTRGPPNYTFASLPYYYDRICTVTQWNDEWAFRMTSPYDCSVSSSYTDLNAGTGTATVVTQAADGSDASAQTARWYNMYAGLYNYYHVVSCKWTMMIENLSTEGIWCHQMYHNDTQPPTGASNQDMLHWPDCKSHYIGPIGHAITSAGVREHNEMVDDMENYEPSTQGPSGITPNFDTTNHISARGQSNIIEFGGSYAPGDFNREIHLDSEVENWTAVTTNPALTERCMFRIRPQWDTIGTNNTGVYDRPLSYRFIYRCDYLVEFKELKDGLRWPVNKQPITISITNSVGAE